MTFVIKRGDTAPAFSKRLYDRSGYPLSLDDVADVSFHMRDKNYNMTVTDNTAGNVTITDSTSGEVEYQWASGDTEEVGTYLAEFELEYTDGRIRTVPAYSDYEIKVVEDIND